MIVISDTNIIYSYFYKPKGVIATILSDKKKTIQFTAPDYLLDEVEEHLPEIMKDNHLSKQQASALLKEFIQNITFFKVKDIPKEYINKAKDIAQSIDPDDYPFLHFTLRKDIKSGLAT